MIWNVLIAVLVIMLEFYAISKGINGFCLGFSLFIVGLCIDSKGVLEWIKKKKRF
jgi:hypothetical protein